MTVMERQWSTGLFDIFADLEVFIYSMTNPCCCLAVNNSVVQNEGKAAFGLPGDKVATAFQCVGCTARDGAMVVNGCLMYSILGLCCLPIPNIVWRAQLRGKLGIEGNLFMDWCMVCYCFRCTMMQEARELKHHGLMKPATMK